MDAFAGPVAGRVTRGRRPSTAGAGGARTPWALTVRSWRCLALPRARRRQLAHDVENTHVLVVFEADDTYRVDVLNDADWLWLQVHPAATADDLPPVEVRNGQLAERASAFARRHDPRLRRRSGRAGRA